MRRPIVSILFAISCGLVVTAAEAAPVANLPLTCSSADAIGQPQDNCNGDWAYQLPNTELIVLKGPSSAPVWSRASSLTNSDTVNICTLPVEPGTYSNCRDAAGVRRYAFVPKSQVFPSPPPPPSATGARILDLLRPVVIAAPGLYIFDRDWRIEGPAGAVIDIAADNVTLDMQGFELFAPEAHLISISGKSVTVRNGRLRTNQRALFSTGEATLVEAMRVASGDVLGAAPAVALAGTGSVLANSFISHLLTAVTASGGTIVRNNRISAGRVAVQAGPRSLVFDNDVICTGDSCLAALAVGGPEAVVSRNTITAAGTAIQISGTNNQVLDNVVLASVTGNTAIEVNFSTHIIGGNTVVTPRDLTARLWRVGILFRGNGNYYGDNVIFAEVPLDFGATVQTDMGNNRTFGP